MDEKILHEALAQYRAWNEAEFVDQVLNAGAKTPEQKWREYRALFAFGRRLRPQPSQAAEEQEAREWEEYYRRVERFEARRRTRG
jgi:transcriptional regulator with AAA-type ATPase domain